MSPSRSAVLLLAACCAAVAVHAHGLLWPVLYEDDFQILAASWTWAGTAAALGHPHNEHIMPLGRLSTWLLVTLTGDDLAWFTRLAAWQAPLGVVAGMALTHHFVRRELGRPLYGVLAATLFGVTSIYQQAVSWYSAGFSVLALDTALLALVCAQNYRLGGRAGWLLPCAALCLAAPCWFASGVLAGPFCAVYLLPLRRDEWDWGRALAPAAPLLGTAAFLGVLVRGAAGTINELEHYQMQGTTAVEAFRPVAGLGLTGRAVVECLALGQFGVLGVSLPVGLLVPLLALVTGAAAWWAWGARSRRLALLGLALILVSYWLTYSARANWWTADRPLNTVAWSRYHLMPQLGLALLVVAGLDGRWRLPPSGAVTRGEWGWAAAVLAAVFVVQLPKGVLGTLVYVPSADGGAPGSPVEEFRRAHDARAEVVRQQQAGYARVARADRVCREHGIAAATVRRTQPRWQIAWGSDKVPAWDFLRGSARPVEPQPDAETVAALLAGP